MDNCQLIRGVFSSSELEKCLWECTWLDWSRMANASVYHVDLPKRLPVSLSIAAKRLSISLNTRFNSISLFKCVEGESINGTLDLTEGEKYVILSIAKFRGGRAKIGPFEGYLNPGEVLLLEGTSSGQLVSKVEKVVSGERIVLNLMLRKN